MHLVWTMNSICQNFVVVNSHFGVTQPSILSHIQQTQTLIAFRKEFNTSRNLSSLDHEFQIHELLDSTKLGINHHVPHCSIVLLHVSSILLTTSAFEYVSADKLVRVN